MFLPDDIFSEYDANLHDAEEEEEEEEYRSSEQYLDQTVTLHPGPGLPAGSHLLPFSLRLPPGLPSSFTQTASSHLQLQGSWEAVLLSSNNNKTKTAG